MIKSFLMSPSAITSASGISIKTASLYDFGVAEQRIILSGLKSSIISSALIVSF